MMVESPYQYYVQGKLKGRGRRWKTYNYTNDRNQAFATRDAQAERFLAEDGWEWRVWDTKNDVQVPGRHYGFNDILAMRETEEQGAKVVLELQEGDTAYHPGTTKRFLQGPLKVTYWIHASGWNTQTEEL